MTLDRVERLADHVLLVSVDGLRPDAIDACDAVHLKELVGRGVHAANARSVEPSLTMPSHASMLTGLEVAGHGVTWNDVTPGWIGHPTLFSAARGAAMRTGAFYAKTKLRYLFRPGTVHVDVCIDGLEDSAGSLARAFATAWSDAPFDLAFVHLREPDSAGHLEGWMSEPYLRAVEAADRAVGEILEAIRASGRLERTAVIVTADHGGTGTHHLSDPEIPWICAGPGVPRGARIEREIRTCDTAPTALLFLGLRADHIDGRPVAEAFRSDK
jgi:predicted AlkP superfamily pyrophosphatase or phosphodiesterase